MGNTSLVAAGKPCIIQTYVRCQPPLLYTIRSRRSVVSQKIETLCMFDVFIGLHDNCRLYTRCNIDPATLSLQCKYNTVSTAWSAFKPAYDLLSLCMSIPFPAKFPAINSGDDSQ